MTKATKGELNGLVEKLIRIKDRHYAEMDRDERDALNDACNVIYYNIDVLTTEEE